MKAYVLPNGFVARLPQNKFSLIRYDLNGFVVGFTTSDGLTYKYFNSELFYNGKQRTLDAGYWEIENYYNHISEYIRGIDNNAQFISLKEFNSDAFRLMPDDIIFSQYAPFTIHTNFLWKEKINFEPLVVEPYLQELLYSNPLLYEFTKENVLVENFINAPNSFPKIEDPILVDFQTRFVEKTPSLLEYDVDDFPIEKAVHRFFSKNFIQPKSTWGLEENGIEMKLCNMRTTLIALKISKICYHIMTDILSFDNLPVNELHTKILNGYNSNWVDSDFDPNAKYLYIIAYHLYKQWEFYPELNNESLFSSYSLEERALYQEKLEELYETWRFNSKDIKSALPYEKLAIFLSLSTPNILSLIPYPIRLDILNFALFDKWIKLNYDKTINRSSYEMFSKYAIVYCKSQSGLENLIRSFTTTEEANALFKFLNQTDSCSNKQVTHFQALYELIKDSQNILWSEMAAKGNVMTHLMYLWILSDFNTCRPFYNLDEVTNTSGDLSLAAIANSLDSMPEPTKVNYQSDKQFQFYFDNRDFFFEKGKITQKITKKESDQIIDFFLPIGQTPFDPYIHSPLESFDIFQPISLVDYKQENHAVKVQMINLSLFGYSEEHAKTAVMPAFFLKYMDDFADKQNFWNAVSLTIDIVLTFSGIGNIAKLRHFKYIGKMGQVNRAFRLSNVTPAFLQTIGTLHKFRLGFAYYEFTASAAHLLLQYTTDNCNAYKGAINSWLQNEQNNQASNSDKDFTNFQDIPNASNEYKLCKALDNFLFLTSIAAGLGEIIAGRLFKKELKNIYENNLWPSGLTSGSDPVLYAIKQELDSAYGVFSTSFQDFMSFLPDSSLKTNLSNKITQLNFSNAAKNSFGEAMEVVFKNAKTPKQKKALLQKLSKNNYVAIENWLNLHNAGLLNLLENTDFFLSPLRTSRFITAKNYAPLALAQLSKFPSTKQINFIDEMGGMNVNQWSIFNNNPNHVDGWFRYHIPMNTRAELEALKGAAGNDYAKVINFLEDYGDAAADIVQKIKDNPMLIDAWAKVDANPLNAAVHSATIKNIDYLEIVHNLHKMSKIKNGKVITLEHHIAGEMTEITHNGVEHIIDYSGFHFDFKITEITPITPTITNINGTPHMTGPIPTSNSAVVRKAGTSNTVNGIENSEILVWGYGRVLNANPPPRWSLALDNAGNPIKAWVSKSSNGGKTSLFPGWNADKTINEIAYARINLNTTDWLPKNHPSGSNEWSSLSSEGTKISIYIGSKFNIRPQNLPSISEKIHSAFPKQ